MIRRGPMMVRALQQMLRELDWGELDSHVAEDEGVRVVGLGDVDGVPPSEVSRIPMPRPLRGSVL